jgi:hypothetical protein
MENMNIQEIKKVMPTLVLALPPEFVVLYIIM